MVRRLALAIAIGFSAQAHADARVSHLAISGDSVTLCRHAFKWVTDGGVRSIDQPTADCWQIDFATGKLASAPIVPNQPEIWPKEPAPGAIKTATGVDVCAADDPSRCTSIAVPHADTYGSVATNAARTIVALQKSPPFDKDPTIVTFDVANGKRLAALRVSGDIMQVLGETLFVQSSCAAPCGGTLYNARTGKKIAVVSDDTPSANDEDNHHIAGNIWQFNETAREEGEPGLLFEDITTGKRIKRIPQRKFTRANSDDDPHFNVFPMHGGLLVVVVQSTIPAFAGDCALIDTKGNVVKRFAAPAWPKP